MNLLEKLHMLHSAWQYRLTTEKNDIAFLLIQNFEGATVIDIGANKGIYSYWLSKKVGPKGKVIAFEPQPELGTHLNDLKESFNLNNLVVINKGLSSTNSRGKLFRPEAGSGAASLRQSSLEWKSVSVELKTLDSYDNILDVQFIKCDVEGHEHDVFKGGERILKRDKPMLLFECHHDDVVKQDLFLYLISLGYEGFFIYKKQLINCSKFKDYPYRNKNEHHRNYFFIHPDSPYLVTKW